MADFARPRISWEQWEREPYKVAQQAGLAMLLHILPRDMTSMHRALIFGVLYQGSGIAQHCTVFVNGLRPRESGEEDSIPYIHEALQTLGATAHAEIFRRACVRWESKPRTWWETDIKDEKKHAEWVRKVWNPVDDEFRDLDEEAFMVRPNLESHIVDFLRKHRREFVEIVK